MTPNRTCHGTYKYKFQLLKNIIVSSEKYFGHTKHGSKWKKLHRFEPYSLISLSMLFPLALKDILLVSPMLKLISV